MQVGSKQLKNIIDESSDVSLRGKAFTMLSKRILSRIKENLKKGEIVVIKTPYEDGDSLIDKMLRENK